MAQTALRIGQEKAALGPMAVLVGFGAVGVGPISPRGLVISGCGRLVDPFFD